MCIHFFKNNLYKNNFILITDYPRIIILIFLWNRHVLQNNKTCHRFISLSLSLSVSFFLSFFSLNSKYYIH